MIRKNWRRDAYESPDHAELGRLLPPPGDPQLPLDRQSLLEEHLMNEIRTQRSATPAPKAPVLKAPSRRPVRRSLLIGIPVTAAALAGVIAFNAVTAAPDAPDARAGRAAAVEAPVVSVETGSSEQLASTVGRIVAAAASKGGLPEPGPGQYVYVKSQVSYLSTSVDVDTDRSKTWVQPLHTREVWKSPDGAKGWLDEPGQQPEGGITLDKDGPHSKPKNGQDIPGEAVNFSYEWLKAQPADPDALLKAVHAAGSGRDRDQEAFEEIGSIIGEQLVPPNVAAALYQAAAKIPGVVVVQHSQDAAGRDGIALARVDERRGSRTELVFDRSTYAYLGSRGVQIRQQDGVKPGTVTERTAVLERGVVDASKQRPDTRHAA
ncbi:CU044_5270 family protein [Streptomyces sp. NBC_01565]|uniref:CU044_5270 family protein n=1 Tax=unclassified Streptomyces TaxID=2593676 RepID=UPI002250926E|nr:CU044_5270 family protein [Streptomyces sp. NBC_01565]MCX4545955.1 CU044_5270 family protein [Streptomyces sp. NBC_01565]